MYAGEDARVFIGPKSGSFLPIVGKFIDRCIEKNCNLDIILVVDRSQSVETDYQKELKTATDVVGLASKSAYETGQVRVGVTSFAREGKLEIPLRKATRANITDMISSIYHTGGSTSAVAGVEQAIRHLLPERRPKTRLLVVLISDGHSQDFWDKLTKTARILQALPNSLFLAATNSEKYSLSELTAWTGNASHVFHSQQIPVFLDRDQIIANVASKVQEIEGSGDVEGSGDGVITTDAVIEKNTPANHTDEPLTDSHEQKPRGVSDPLNEGIPLVTRPGTIKSTFDGKGPCKVDLVFVVDISTSVEQEFEKQRQFTLDLVNRLPREDFDNRVHVGIIAFHNRARVVEPLGRQRTKESIINVLSNITDEGGSTSVAAGMKLAADEITRGRRSDASTATPSVVADFSEILERNRLFVAAKNIPAVQNVADYHKAVTFALKELRKNARKSSRKALIVVGPGSLTEGPINVDIPSEITRYAVDSSDKSSISSLEMLTGARKNVFEFDRNAEFEKALLKLALPTSRMCKELLMKNFEPTIHLSKKAIPDAEETTKKTTTSASTTRAPKVFRNPAAPITRSTEKPTTTARTTTIKLRLSTTSRSSAAISMLDVDEQRIENSTHFVSAILRALHSTPFSSGTTAAHSALQRAISEYSSARGARPGRATPIAIVFTDGFAQKSIESEAAQLRRLIPNTFAVAINQNQRINRDVLETIAGSRSRVFTDEDIQRFLDTLAAHANDCRP
ncbi:unnamed protein product, partial [Mesorhabditis spiculigera]